MVEANYFECCLEIIILVAGIVEIYVLTLNGSGILKIVAKICRIPFFIAINFAKQILQKNCNNELGFLSHCNSSSRHLAIVIISCRAVTGDSHL